MANRRQLKKHVKFVTTLAAGMCFLAGNEAKENNVAYTDLMDEVFELRREILSRISHTEPGNVKAFYKKLHEDLTNGLNDIMNRLFELEAK